MQAAHQRLLYAALWPVSVWASLTHLDDHAADDFVERTSPIVAFAIGFWVLIIAIAAMWFMNGPRVPFQTALFFLPFVYAIGLWMYAERDGRYPR